VKATGITRTGPTAGTATQAGVHVPFLTNGTAGPVRTTRSRWQQVGQEYQIPKHLRFALGERKKNAYKKFKYPAKL
jgi:hypothetical protein